MARGSNQRSNKEVKKPKKDKKAAAAAKVASGSDSNINIRGKKL